MSTIATICARGGSKGVPGKNQRLMLGKPLIAYTIEQALNCPEVDGGVYVSTDSPELAEIAVQAGGTVLGLRPAHMATDSAPKVPVIQHLVAEVEQSGREVTRVVDLDPTSPLREISDISGTLALLDEDTDLVITGYEAEKNPYFNMVETKQDGNVRLVCPPADEVFGRQSAPTVWAMNGSVYVWWRRTLTDSLWNGRVRMFDMPRERSIDIDHPIDWTLVELLLKERQA